MILSYQVIAIGRANDEETAHLQKMKAIWDACRAADISPPTVVCDFFRDMDPVFDMDGACPGGRYLSLNDACLRNYCDGRRRGYDVELAKLPPGIEIIRFYLTTDGQSDAEIFEMARQAQDVVIAELRAQAEKLEQELQDERNLVADAGSVILGLRSMLAKIRSGEARASDPISFNATLLSEIEKRGEKR